MTDGYYLTPDDLEIFRKIAKKLGYVKDGSGTPPPNHYNNSPDIYITKTPSEGIPPINVDGDTGDVTLEPAECIPHRVSYDWSTSTWNLLEASEDGLNVFNLASAQVPSQYMLAVRDRFGEYLSVPITPLIIRPFTYNEDMGKGDDEDKAEVTWVDKLNDKGIVWDRNGWNKDAKTDSPGYAAYIDDQWEIISKTPASNQQTPSVMVELLDDVTQWQNGEEFEEGCVQVSGKVVQTCSSTSVMVDETVLVSFTRVNGRALAVGEGSIVSAAILNDTSTPKVLTATSDYTMGAGATVIKAKLNDTPPQWDNEDYEPGVTSISATVTQVISGGEVEVNEIVDIEFPSIKGRSITYTEEEIVGAVLLNRDTSPKRFLITSDYTQGSGAAILVKARIFTTVPQWDNGDDYEPGTTTIDAEVTEVLSGEGVSVNDLLAVDISNLKDELVALEEDDIILAAIYDLSSTPKKAIITSDYTRSSFKLGCGLTRDEDDNIIIDNTSLPGQGLKASSSESSEASCQIEVNAGPGLKFLSDALIVNNEDLAGPGLVADSKSVALGVLLGHALQYESLTGAIAVDPFDLVGDGLQIGLGGLTLSAKPGFALDLVGGAIAVESEKLAGTGIKVENDGSLGINPGHAIKIDSGTVDVYAGDLTGDGLDTPNGKQLRISIQPGTPIQVVTNVECNEEGELEVTYATLELKVDGAGLYLEATSS